MSSRALDAGVLSGCLVLCALVISYSVPPLLALASLLFGLPCAYLVWRRPSYFGRNAVGALLVGVLFGFLLDFFGALNGAWTYHNQFFVFSGWIAQRVPLEIMAWVWMWSLYIVSVYTHFFDSAAPKGLSARFVPMAVVSLIGAVNLVLLPHSAALFTIPYAYLWWGMFSALPLVAAAWLYPGRLRGLCIAALLVVPSNLLFEWAALKIGYWSFTGEYLYIVVVWGRALPLEEVLCWAVLSPFVVLANFLLFVRTEG